MPTQTVAQALAYINWTVLMALAVGSFAGVVGLRRATDATSGYLSMTSGLGAALGILAWISDTGLPRPDALAIVAASPVIDTARRAATIGFVVASATAAIVVRRGSNLGSAGPLGIGSGVLTFVLAAAGWSSDPVDAVPLAVQYLALSAATGTALAAVILAHWYLVTPRLGERPLILTTRALTAAVGLQLLLFATWAAFGTGAEASGVPFSVLTGSAALLVWLRLGVSLGGPLVLSVMAERTARTRSMESATGLLYIDLAAIVSGTIVAAALAYGGGLLV